MTKWCVVLLFVPVSAMACKDGYVPTDTPGICVEQAQPVQPSDEKPPEEKHLDDYRPDVVNAPSTEGEDEKEDKEKADADREGKAAIGIKVP